MEKRKVFKQRNKYYYSFILRCILLLQIICGLYWVVEFTEYEAYDFFVQRDLIGGSGQRTAVLIQKLIVKNWGRTGMIIFISIILFFALYYFVKEILEFRRFLKKDRLYKHGLVHDLYDDYEPKSLLQIAKSLFKKQTYKRRVKYPKSRDIKNKLKNDKLYQKMYGDDK